MACHPEGSKRAKTQEAVSKCSLKVANFCVAKEKKSSIAKDATWHALFSQNIFKK
jgi:hypothetical protein